MASADLTRLEVKRIFNAPRERVFAVFTTPDLVRQWIGGQSIQSPSAEIDLREGGQYRIAVQPPNSDPFFIVGVFQEVRAPEKLVYTWSHENGGHPTVVDTLVTVEFLDQDGKTEVVLQHERFSDIQVRQEHTNGWEICLDTIAEMLWSSA